MIEDFSMGKGRVGSDSQFFFLYKIMHCLREKEGMDLYLIARKLGENFCWELL